MVYGYARVSTKGQEAKNSLDWQEQESKNAGAQKIYKDTFTESKKKRPEFNFLDIFKIQLYISFNKH